MAQNKETLTDEDGDTPDWIELWNPNSLPAPITGWHLTDDPADLSKLHDIVTPPDVSWWPLAPGWLVLLAIAIAALCYYIYRFLRKWKGNAYRREALNQLNAAESASHIAEILKRTALVVAPREKIAQLNGGSWIDWLSEQSGAEPSEEVRTALTRSLYHPAEPAKDLTGLKEFATNWISKHQRPC